MSVLCSAFHRRGRVSGNREVSRSLLLLTRADQTGAGVKAYAEEVETEGKHGFPSGSEPQANDAVER
jgi:hypothetical protein